MPRRTSRWRLDIAAAFLVASCAATQAGPSAVPPDGGSARPSNASSATTGRPVILTTDLDASDLFATAILLRTPGLDVRAIGIDGTGIVHCRAGERNLAWLLEELGALGIPFGCGPTTTALHALRFPADWRARADAAYGISRPETPAARAAGPAGEVIARAIEASPAPPLIVALGPWTTLARLFADRPDLVGRVAGIHAMAGVIDAPGNVEIDSITSADPLEWNVAADPDAFAAVLDLGIPVTLVPLDATDDVPVPTDFVTQLASDHAAAGADIAYELELRNPLLATTPGQQLWDELAVATITTPDLATWARATVTVTLDDRPAGRLLRSSGGHEVRYAASADRERSIAAILTGLRRGAPRPEPFTLAGEISVAWDGMQCRIVGTPTAIAGEALVRLHAGGPGPAGLGLVGIAGPHTWAEVIDLLRDLDFSTEIRLPDWITQIEGHLGAEPGQDAVALVTLPSGTVGVVCISGAFPHPVFTPAAALELSPPG